MRCIKRLPKELIALEYLQVHIQKVRLRKLNRLLDTGESNQSVLVEINPEWIEGTDVDVKTEIKFTSVDQQRLIDVTKRTDFVTM